MNNTIKLIGSVEETNKTNFENALLSNFNSMSNGEIRIGQIYANYASSVTQGASAVGIYFRVRSGIYKIAIPDACTRGYYYSGSWHWSAAQMSDI